MPDRRCRECKKRLKKRSVYLTVALNSDVADPGIAVGLPLHLQGDYCSVTCLRVKLDNP